jgi:hypothetical protein
MMNMLVDYRSLPTLLSVGGSYGVGLEWGAGCVVTVAGQLIMVQSDVGAEGAVAGGTVTFTLESEFDRGRFTFPPVMRWTTWYSPCYLGGGTIGDTGLRRGGD